MSMELESEEDTNRWGKSSPPYTNNQSQSSSSSPSPPKKKKKKRHHSSKKKKKRKRSKSKKKKSATKKADNRWRPQPDTNDNNPPQNPTNKPPTSPTPQTKSFKINNDKQKIKISFNNLLKTSLNTTSSTTTTSSSKSRSKSPPKPTKKSHKNRSSSRSRSHSRSPSRSRSRSRSRSSSNSFQRRRYTDVKGRYSRERQRDRNRYNKYDHFTYSPPRCYRDAMQRNPRIKEKRRINHKVIAALNEIQEKHKDDNTHPLDLKQQELNRNVASKKDKAMIWAAASGNFETEILKSAHFQKNISLALNALNVGNKDFDIAVLFKQFSNYSVKLIWKDCSRRDCGINKSELLTFRDLMSIRSYRKELNHCNALWKFIFYDQRHLFWSMAIYYALIKTTLVPEWDEMFEKQYDLIRKYGKNDYIEKDVQQMEERQQDRKLKRDKNRKQSNRKHDDMSDHDMDNDSV